LDIEVLLGFSDDSKEEEALDLWMSCFEDFSADFWLAFMFSFALRMKLPSSDEELEEDSEDSAVVFKISLFGFFLFERIEGLRLFVMVWDLRFLASRNNSISSFDIFSNSSSFWVVVELFFAFPAGKFNF